LPVRGRVCAFSGTAFCGFNCMRVSSGKDLLKIARARDDEGTGWELS
jgi:hypothetical protein